MRWVVLALVLVGCMDAAPDAPPIHETSRVVTFDLPLATPPKLDLLFVIDSSPAIAAHASNLRTNYRALMATLATLGGGVPNLRIAVVTTDLGTLAADDTHGGTLGDRCRGRGDDARFRTAPSGDVLRSRPLADGSRLDSFEGSLADAFATLADAGGDGCELTQPLEAMRRALVARPDFVRADAFLHVVFITAQDDCSFGTAAFLDGLRTTPIDTYRCYARADELIDVDAYVTFLQQLKPDPAKVMVSLAAGPPGPVLTVDEWRHQFIAPACSYAGATAAPAPRLHQFASAFINRSAVASLCQPDLTALLTYSPLLDRSVPNPCIDVPLRDADPDAAGVQPTCAVSFAVVERTTIVDEHTIPSCDDTSSRPCWRIEADARWCPFGAMQRVVIEHGPIELVANTHALGQCLIE